MRHHVFNAQELKELAEEAGFTVQSYSGRYMYGKECVGIVAENMAAVIPKLMGTAAITWSHEGMSVVELGDRVDSLAELMAEVRLDSMGLDTVLYWPSVEWLDVDEEPVDDTELTEFQRANAAYLARSVTGDPEVIDEPAE